MERGGQEAIIACIRNDYCIQVFMKHFIKDAVEWVISMTIMGTLFIIIYDGLISWANTIIDWLESKITSRRSGERVERLRIFRGLFEQQTKESNKAKQSVEDGDTRVCGNDSCPYSRINSED